MATVKKQKIGGELPVQRVISIRLIVSLVAVVLISAAVIGAGTVTERNAREALLQELETRLTLEARDLATISGNALLTDYPELTLHPMIKEMKSQRPDIGAVFVVDHDGIVQGHSDAGRLGTVYTQDATLQHRDAKAKLAAGEELLGNADLLVLRSQVVHPNGSPMGFVVVGLKRSHTEALLVAARKNQILLFVPLLVVSILLTGLLMTRLLQPITKIRSGIEKIGRGDLNTRVDVSSRTELGLVATSINNMVGQLKIAQTELLEKERLDHEMQLARKIQHSLLPKQATKVGEFEIFGAQDAAAEVGGDYYDVFELPDGRIGIVIADVAGKGLAGCLVTSMLAVLIRTLRDTHDSPKDLIVALNEIIRDSLQPGTFITVFYGLIDPETNQLRFASAGHNPLLHFDATLKTIAWHKTGGIPVGLTAAKALRETLADGTLKLKPGDVVLQTTDGFNEAVNPEMDEYGFERLAETVKTFAPRGGKALIDGVQESVMKWEAALPAGDDKTLIAIHRVQHSESEAFEKPAELPSTITQRWAERQRGDFLSIPARLEDLNDMGARIKQCTGLGRMSDEELGLIEQGLYEVIGNIIEHACLLDKTKTVDVWWMGDSGPSGCGLFLIRDRGLPQTPEYWIPLQLSRSKGRGYGLQIIQQTLTEVEVFPSTADGNITLVFVASPNSDPRSVS